MVLLNSARRNEYPRRRPEGGAGCAEPGDLLVEGAELACICDVEDTLFMSPV